MDEIMKDELKNQEKISMSIDKEKTKEPEQPKNTNTEDLDARSTKTLFLVLGIIILAFALFFVGKYFAGEPTGAVTIEDLHKQNLEGDIKNGYLHNGFSFIQDGALWYTKVQIGNNLIDIPLHYGPKDLEEIPIEGQLDERFYQKEIYITFNPTDPKLTYVALGTAELSLNMAKGLGITPKAACDRNKTEACEDRPIITCDSGLPTIYVKQAEENKIELKGNCAILQGKDEGVVKAVDRFLLELYGVMER